MNAALRCRSCGATALRDIGRGARGRNFAGTPLDPVRDGGRLVRCTRCDLLMRHPLLTPAEYVALYAPSSGGFWTKSALRPEQQRLCAYVRRVLPQGGEVLDVGCASGDLLDGLGPRYSKFGVEPSTDAAERARQVGVQVLCSAVDQLAACERQFDLITAVDVIEHVPDPLAFLRALSRRLKPGGRIVVSTGNSRARAWRWCGPGYYYAHFFEHVSFISDRWCAWAGTQGFEVELLEPLFVHQGSEPESGAARLKKRLLFAAKFVPAFVERTLLTRLPTTARRLGLRLMLAEPGMFADHLMVAFRLPATDPTPNKHA